MHFPKSTSSNKQRAEQSRAERGGAEERRALEQRNSLTRHLSREGGYDRLDILENRGGNPGKSAHFVCICTSSPPFVCPSAQPLSRFCSLLSRTETQWKRRFHA